MRIWVRMWRGEGGGGGRGDICEKVVGYCWSCWRCGIGGCIASVVVVAG